MSCNYADGLSPYHDKGKLGLAEQFDAADEVEKKVKMLANWINKSKHVVIHTGAGISTSAGIPDFRGPKGVWTLEEKGEKPVINISFNEAIPTKTHMAILKLVQVGKVHFVISQNIDGLHLRSGLPRKYLAELHGNMFIEQCHKCHRQFVRNSATSSVGQKCLEKSCPTLKSNGRPCRGKLHDIILDWEHDLPEKDLGLADFHSCLADLSICLGTTLQIVPSGTLPLNTKKYNYGKLIICNLQPTKYDKKADLLIHTYVDNMMMLLMKELNLEIPEFSSKIDPTRIEKRLPVEWTIPDSEVKRMRSLYELNNSHNCCKSKKKRKIVDELDECKSSVKLSKPQQESETSSKVCENVKQETEETSEKQPETNGVSISTIVKKETCESECNTNFGSGNENESTVSEFHREKNRLPFCDYDDNKDSLENTIPERKENSYILS